MCVLPSFDNHFFALSSKDNINRLFIFVTVFFQHLVGWNQANTQWLVLSFLPRKLCLCHISAVLNSHHETSASALAWDHKHKKVRNGYERLDIHSFNLPIVTSEEDQCIVDHACFRQSLQNLPNSAVKLHQSIAERPSKGLTCILFTCILRVVCMLKREREWLSYWIKCKIFIHTFEQFTMFQVLHSHVKGSTERRDAHFGRQREWTERRSRRRPSQSSGNLQAAAWSSLQTWEAQLPHPDHSDQSTSHPEESRWDSDTDPSME